MPAALKMPQIFVKFVDLFAILNFATVPRIVRIECKAQFDHYASVFMITLGPLVLTALGALCLRVQQQRTPSLDARTRLAAQYFGVFLLMTYLVFPSATTTLFQTFRCEVFDHPEYEGDEFVVSYLRADLRLECGRGPRSALGVGGGFDWNQRYNAMWWYSLWLCFVYPLGIPLMYFCLLYAKRDIIAPKMVEGASEDAVEQTQTEGASKDAVAAPPEDDTSMVDSHGPLSMIEESNVVENGGLGACFRFGF